jgi:hypothetical protein
VAINIAIAMFRQAEGITILNTVFYEVINYLEEGINFKI